MNTTRKTLTLLMAALMLLYAVPAAAFARAIPAVMSRTVPAGFDEHDYNALVAFLEQIDENGIKNGEKLSEAYDPADPGTWGKREWDGADYFVWDTINGLMHIYSILLEGNVTGSLDVSQCLALETLYCCGNSLVRLNVSQCPSILRIDCSGNCLTMLDISQCPELKYLYCYDNDLSELDVSQCRDLKYLYCYDNRFSSLDLTSNVCSPIDRISSEGNGYIGLLYFSESDNRWGKAFAEGANFIGWYDESGSLLSTETELNISNNIYMALIARFDNALLGDIDGNGVVNANDALAVLRSALGLSDGVGPSGDVTGDGIVNANDALLILRIALGLATL